MKKWFKRIIYTLLFLVIGVVAYAYISGNVYTLFMLRHTVLKGKMGPDISEYTIYTNARVEASDHPFIWPLHPEYENKKLTEEENAYHREFQSAGFVVIKKGMLIFEQYWDQFSDSSRTNSWSIAKSMVSHMIGCALRDGQIKSLDEPVGNYLEKYKGDEVTIRDLLMMSAGYDFFESYQDPFGYTARALYGSDAYEALEPYRLTESSGEVFDYKSAITQLLGLIVTKATGKSLSAYASEKIWKPIGARQDALWSVYEDDNIERAFCCFNSNARDYAKFGFLYLHRGVAGNDTLIDPEYFELATKPTPIKLLSGEPNDRYGYQWWCSEFEGEQFFYARGLNGQYIVVLPESEMVMVRLGERQSPVRVGGHREDVFRYIKMAKRLAGLSG
jgi:CubicO group peptidase (beta-lactamase class C family)